LCIIHFIPIDIGLSIGSYQESIVHLSGFSSRSSFFGLLLWLLPSNLTFLPRYCGPFIIVSLFTCGLFLYKPRGLFCSDIYSPVI
jgi:hypothetical protein